MTYLDSAQTILAVRAAFPDPARIISAGEKAAAWGRGTVANGAEGIRDVELLSISATESMKDLDAELVEFFRKYIALYTEKNPIVISSDEGYDLLKYTAPTGHYDAHHDGPHRILSAILYLNDEFTGGALEYIKQGITVQPEPGLLLLFPSAFPYLHKAHPVTEGVRYAVVSFFK